MLRPSNTLSSFGQLLPHFDRPSRRVLHTLASRMLAFECSNVVIINPAAFILQRPRHCELKCTSIHTVNRLMASIWMVRHLTVTVSSHPHLFTNEFGS